MGYHKAPWFETAEEFEQGRVINWEQKLSDLQDKHIWSKSSEIDKATHDEVHQLVFKFLNDCIDTCIEPIKPMSQEERDSFLKETLQQIHDLEGEIEKNTSGQKKRTALETLYESLQYTIERLANTFRTMAMCCINDTKYA